MIDPRTPAEWQEAVNGAEGALALDAARQYGLVAGGPTVNLRRCEEILEEGAARGILPQPDAIPRFLEGIVRKYGVSVEA